MFKKCAQLVRPVLLWMSIVLSALLRPLCSLSLPLPSTELFAATLYHLATSFAHCISYARFSVSSDPALLARSVDIFGSFCLDFLVSLPLFRIHRHCSWQTRRAGPSFWRSKNFLSFSSQYILISGITASTSTSRLGIAWYAPVIFRRHAAYARSSSRTTAPLFPGSYYASAP
jgi:hypothetical protein